MKSLLIMRHAKSSWAEAGIQDHDRPLNQRGERDAPRMAKWLQSQGLVPDQIICSSAKRTYQTAQAVSAILDRQIDIIEELYLANMITWQTVLSNYEEPETLLAIGHNPGIEQFIEHTCGEYQRMPTAAIAWFKWNPESTTTLRDLKLQEIWCPKEIQFDQD